METGPPSGGNQGKGNRMLSQQQQHVLLQPESPGQVRKGQNRTQTGDGMLYGPAHTDRWEAYPMMLTWKVVGEEVGSILAESSPQGT